jgi:hypothetical protein
LSKSLTLNHGAQIVISCFVEYAIRLSHSAVYEYVLITFSHDTEYSIWCLLLKTLNLKSAEQSVMVTKHAMLNKNVS